MPDLHPHLPMIPASMRFHPRDKSQLAMFWREHDRIVDRLSAWSEIQSGPNPITREEFERLQQRFPERWASMPWFEPRAAQ